MGGSLLVALALTAVPAAGIHAQGGAGPEGAASASARAESCGWSWRALGVTGVRCSGCTLDFDGARLVGAAFRTEPEVTGVDAGLAGGDRLRPGDRIVSVEGRLVGTDAGVDALLSIGRGDAVTVTVRRDGRVRDLEIVAGDPCPPAPAAAPEPPHRAEPDAPPAGEPRAPAPREPGAAPPAPTRLLPDGYLGFGFRCSQCGMRGDGWFFTTPPTVTGVVRGGPAWEAGIRTGDVLEAVDGHPIGTEEGEAAFSGIEAGDRVTWRVRRDGGVRTLVLVAGEPSDAAPRAPAPRPAGAPGEPGPEPRVVADVLRYQGTVGGASVEVRGAPVTVSVDEETGEVVIRTSDTVVRIERVEGGG